MVAKYNNVLKRRQMQNSLYEFARKGSYTFPNLYEKIYSSDMLEEAWLQVKSTNQLTVDALEAAEAYGIGTLLQELHSELQFELYRIKRTAQENPDTALREIKNRITMTAAKNVLYPIFKADFDADSSVVKSNRQLHVKTDTLLQSSGLKNAFRINVSIKSCFASIPHEMLLNLIEQRISDQEVLNLLKFWISSGTIYEEDTTDSPYGIDKSLLISPLLMSIYLGALDQAWNENHRAVGMWLRHADRIIVLGTNRYPADHIKKQLITLLKQFGLEPDTVEIIQPIHTDQPGNDVTAATALEPVPIATEQDSGGFCGYKYRFGLYAAHSNLNNSDENIHFHNFTITLYIHTGSRSDDNFAVEKAVQDWLAPLQGMQLSKSDLFEGKETTIEGIGTTLMDALHELILQLGYELIKLSIYENPIRVYSVSYQRLDSTVNVISDISLGCIPVIHLEEESEETKSDEPYEESALLTAAAAEEATVEESLIEAALAIEDETDPAPDAVFRQPSRKPNVFLVMLKCILGLSCFVALAAITMVIVKDSGRYPQGSDTFCHLYRGDLLLKNIQQGNWFPLYDGTWYNGVEIMRYWGPLPLYILAGLEWILQSGILDTYILFLGALIVLGGCGWLLWGITYRRIGLSVIIGLLWFYMPENTRVVILEGNLPRGVINALLPFFFFFLWRVMAEKKRSAIVPLVLITSLITLCHLGITLMLIASILIFVVFHTSLNHTLRSSLCALGASISGVFLAGLWVVPALIGGAASGSSTNQVMKFFFESAFISLNPFTRINGDMLSFYFGLSVFLLCILGMLCGPKEAKAGFITAVVLLVCTTKSVYELFAKLPFSQFLWMIRFIPIGLAAAMVSFLLWKQLKKWAVVLLALLLVADCSTSIKNIYFPPEYRLESAQANLDKRAEEALITDAKEITRQRMALMDLSEYGSFAPYYITGVGNPVNFTFGAGWEGAATASNIVQLNASVEYGWYVYLFDRALELGNDTVLIPIDNLKEKTKDLERLKEAASLSGYVPVKNDGTSILFHKDTPVQFGVRSKYQAIAIGDAASGISMIFPGFEEGSKTDINDYSFEELSTYRTIYLSGFTYRDKAAAEELLSRLADQGVNIFIDMNRIPVDEIKKSMELFGVTSQSIAFTESFPSFTYQGNNYTSLDFSYGVGDWNTVYLLGLDKVDGSCNMNGKVMPFLGTAGNKNLHFIGLNLVYYLQTTRDSEITKLAESIFGLNVNSLPEREVVPIQIRKDSNQITILSDYDNVNTTLSYIDIFHSDQAIRTVNHLVTVSSGTTVLRMRYPHMEKGLTVTAIGMLLALLSYILMRNRKEPIHHETSNEAA